VGKKILRDNLGRNASQLKDKNGNLGSLDELLSHEGMFEANC
jgi:hypothetical protein